MTASSQHPGSPVHNQTSLKLHGDVCPSWCCGKHFVDRSTHVDDAGVHHESGPVDHWHPIDSHGRPDDQPLTVTIEGFRHDNGDDWPDTIRAVNVYPGGMGDLRLHPTDARRLAHALLAACDLADQATAPVNG